MGFDTGYSKTYKMGCIPSRYAGQCTYLHITYSSLIFFKGNFFKLLSLCYNVHEHNFIWIECIEIVLMIFNVIQCWRNAKIIHSYYKKLLQLSL